MFVYGEDAMTLYALTTGKKRFLELLPDYEESDRDLFFYRPSFGRGGPAAQGFGEFDAIIASKSHIYLIESKWQRENTTKEEFKLDAPQVFRHVIFQWIYKQWNAWKQQKKNAEEKWSNFKECKECDYQDHLKTFHDAYESKPLPTAGKLLAENLQCVLKELRDHFEKKKPTITNVLLLFYEKEVVENWKGKDVNKFKVTTRKSELKAEVKFKVVPFELTSMKFVEKQTDKKEKKSKIFKLKT